MFMSFTCVYFRTLNLPTHTILAKRHSALAFHWRSTDQHQSFVEGKQPTACSTPARVRIHVPVRRVPAAAAAATWRPSLSFILGVWGGQHQVWQLVYRHEHRWLHIRKNLNPSGLGIYSIQILMFYFEKSW